MSATLQIGHFIEPSFASRRHGPICPRKDPPGNHARPTSFITSRTEEFVTVAGTAPKMQAG
jgi:hypothetical protein